MTHQLVILLHVFLLQLSIFSLNSIRSLLLKHLILIEGTKLIVKFNNKNNIVHFKQLNSNGSNLIINLQNENLYLKMLIKYNLFK